MPQKNLELFCDYKHLHTPGPVEHTPRSPWCM